MTDPTTDPLADRPVGQAAADRQHASADVAPELFAERLEER
ncbi:hypothetical protein U4E84_10900 [Halorubrum sp. AD140]|nr:hypothetical protein [Halorubrum sp. AD140]MDZ5811848.1 hypothetical protein [Halorubrum sp. AD140]